MKRKLVLVLVVLVVGAGAGLFVGAKINRKMDAERMTEQVVEAERLFAEGRAADAADLLTTWRERAARDEAGERILTLSMRALDASGQRLDAMTVAQRYLDTFPKGEARADAEAILLRPLVEADPGDAEVRASVDRFLVKYPDHPAGGRLQVALARADFREGRPQAARERLLTLWESGPPEAVEAQVADLLGEINFAELYSPTPLPGEKVVELQQGQFVYNIARDHGIPLDFLLEANRIADPTRLRIGQKIRIPNINFSLLCDKAENTLVVYNHGRFFKRYPVRTGRRPDSTPTGEFRILNKKKAPTWRSPIDGKTYKPGDPKNELGTRWMAFEGDILGIHGTIHPETVGHYASNGCIGLLKEDVEELFTYVPVGTTLRIVGKQDLARHRVIEPGEEIRDLAAAR